MIGERFVRTLCLACVLSMLGCGLRQGATNATRVPRVPDKDATPFSDAIVEESCRRFEAGTDALINGDVLAANTLFDEALWLVIEHRRSFPELQQQYDFLVDEINAVSREYGGYRSDARVAYDVATLERLLDGILSESDIEHIGEESEVLDQASAFPVVTNRAVQRFVEVFTGDRADVIEGSLQRSAQYMPMIREVLREFDLPEELAYLPLIESGYKSHARSHAAATGMWQFMRGTGRDFGLRVDPWIDQRLDPLASTRAAARYLSVLHEMFDDWYLALAAYNAGPGRVRSAIRRGGSRDFWTLARKRLFPRETIGYVPAFLAGLEIAKDPKAHGFDNPFEVEEVYGFDSLKIDFGLELAVLAEAMSIPEAELKALNPALIRGITPTDGSAFDLRVPLGMSQSAQAAIVRIPENRRIRVAYHRVRSGETLSGVARHYNISVSAIQHANGIRNPNRLRIGQQLMIPLSGIDARIADSPMRVPGKETDYRIRRGDTLSAIARRYRTSVASLLALNPQIDPLRLMPGQRLRVLQGNGAGRGFASNSARDYTVRSGDTLAAIASRFGTSVRALVQANRLDAPDRLSVGQQLRIPSSSSDRPTRYQVRRGDTLSGIAARYRVNVSKIVRWNRLSSQHLIREGDVLLLYP